MKFYLVNLTEKAHRFMNESVIMSWNNINKTILVLVLGGFDHLLWVFWCIYSYMHPSLQKWINVENFHHLIYLLILNTGILFLLILPTYFLRHNIFIKKYMPYIAICFFACTFIHGGYVIGIMSPTTIAGYISLISVGLVLFERKIIYIVFIPVTVFLLGAIYLSNIGAMSYAPFFSDALNQSVLYQNQYWIYSMMYLYIPIFFASIVLFEILLIQWKNRERTINEISLKDPLTGIFNRRHISLNLSHFHDEGNSYAVILLDLDYFKSINDRFGHEAGDLVLKKVAKILNGHISEHDFVGRFGGEEFIIVLYQKDLSEAIEIAERIRNEIEKKSVYIDRNLSFNFTASFGVALSAENLSKDCVIRLADQALYLAKAKGRNQVCHYLEVSVLEN